MEKEKEKENTQYTSACQQKALKAETLKPNGRKQQEILAHL